MTQISLPSFRLSAIRPWAEAHRPLVKSLIIAEIMAVVWWVAALVLRGLGVIVWYDQVHIFRASVFAIAHPYSVNGFVNMPWVVPIIAPFAFLPVEISVLLQTGLMFGILTLIILRFGGDFRAVVLTLASFMCLDAVLEMNVEWVVMIGLLVPVAYSAPFLLIKPQLALGYYFAVPPKKWIPVAIVALIVLGLSLLIWGFWIPDMITGIRNNSLGRFFNLAPINLMPWPISVAIGLFIAYHAFRKKDEPLGILAGFFFVPYFPPYSLPLIFAMVAIKFKRLAIVIFLSMWIIYGGIILLGVLRR